MSGSAPVATRLGGVAGLVALGSMLVTPVAPRGGRARRALAVVTVAAGFVRTLATEVRVHGIARGGGATSLTVLLTALLERDGVRSGRWFGCYHYTGALRPQVGGVPIVVPLAWAAMAPPAHAVADGALGARSVPIARVVTGAVALTAWDLFLDPQMTREGYWRWARRGAYRGIPLRNFTGWLIVSAVLMLVREFVVGPPIEGRAAHVTTYGTVGVMETTAFATFFDDPVVAIAAGVPMLSFTTLASRRGC